MYVTRAFIVFLTPTSIQSKCERHVDAGKMSTECLHAIGDRTIHFQVLMTYARARFQLVTYAIARYNVTRTDIWKHRKIHYFNYSDCEITKRYYIDLFYCNWRFIWRIKHGHMSNFDAKITQDNKFSAFDERFLRCTWIMNITFKYFMDSKLHCEPFKSYTRRDWIAIYDRVVAYYVTH